MNEKHVFYEGQVLWSQIDPNMHLRHSAYADFATQARFAMLVKFGLKPDLFSKLKIGPVLFREELIYLREVGPNDAIKVTCEITKSRPDASRFSIRQEILLVDGAKAAIINIDGAWIDLVTRKLTPLPPELNEMFLKMPRSEDFVEEVPKEKVA